MSSTPDEIRDMSFPIGAVTANPGPLAWTVISQHQPLLAFTLLRLLWEKSIKQVAKQQIYFSQF